VGMQTVALFNLIQNTRAAKRYLKLYVLISRLVGVYAVNLFEVVVTV